MERVKSWRENLGQATAWAGRRSIVGRREEMKGLRRRDDLELIGRGR